MQIKTILSVTLFFLLVQNQTTAQIDTSDLAQVKIKTSFGNMIVALYDKTPQHRDNFLKLVKNDFYDSLLFHRVIKDFMIQGGDPESKGAPKSKKLGEGGPGYTIPAEFDSTLIHRKGALAAARQPDRVNPEKKSSGSQFYIVKGKVWNAAMLNSYKNKMSQRRTGQLIDKYIQKPENAEIKAELKKLQKDKKFKAMNALYSDIEDSVKNNPDYKPFRFSEAQKEAYTTVGGTPHLDNGYTVFGQVVKGLHVIDSIAAQPTNKMDRPQNNIIMEMEVIKE